MHKDSFYWDAMCLRLLYYARILQQCFALLCQRKTVCDLLLFSRLSCVIFNAMHDAIFCFRLFEVLHLHYNSASQYFAIYAQRKTVCDLRLLFRLSDLNGQIPPPLCLGHSAVIMLLANVIYMIFIRNTHSNTAE